LLRVLPFITEEECFALKGGTAINLFVRDMPRLSVDIDLTYVPVAPRAESLADIDAATKRIVAKIKEKIPGAQLHETQKEGAIVKLVEWSRVRALNYLATEFKCSFKSSRNPQSATASVPRATLDIAQAGSCEKLLRFRGFCANETPFARFVSFLRRSGLEWSRHSVSRRVVALC
jgi:hypothetical protein